MTKINLYPIFKKRILTFPVYEKEPKDQPTAWGLFPEFTLTEAQIAENLEYRYPTFLYSESPGLFPSMVDAALDMAKLPIEFGGWEIWLHAADIKQALRVSGQKTEVLKIIFIFRARKVFILEKGMLSGSISEIPQITAAEKLTKEKPKEEVKTNG